MKDTDPYVMTGKECFGPVKIVKQFMKAKNINQFRPVKIERLFIAISECFMTYWFIFMIFLFFCDKEQK